MTRFSNRRNRITSRGLKLLGKFRKARFEVLETKAAPSGSLEAILGFALLSDVDAEQSTVDESRNSGFESQAAEVRAVRPETRTLETIAPPNETVVVPQAKPVDPEALDILARRASILPGLGLKGGLFHEGRSTDTTSAMPVQLNPLHAEDSALIPSGTSNSSPARSVPQLFAALASAPSPGARPLEPAPIEPLDVSGGGAISPDSLDGVVMTMSGDSGDMAIPHIKFSGGYDTYEGNDSGGATTSVDQPGRFDVWRTAVSGGGRELPRAHDSTGGEPGRSGFGFLQ